MIDTTKEELISLKQAAKSIPTFDGNSVHAGSVWRWCRKGLKGIKLEYVRCGRRIATSQEALNRFFHKLALLDEANMDSQPTDSSNALEGTSPSSSDKRVLEVEETLDRAGL